MFQYQTAHVNKCKKSQLLLHQPNSWMLDLLGLLYISLSPIISLLLPTFFFFLWPKMWSILENVPCALEKKVYSAFGWNVLKISMRSISSIISFKICVSLLIFCFDDLSIGVIGVLKSPTIIVWLSSSPFMSVSVCLRRRQWHPTPVLLPGKSHGRRSLVGCSPWGR